MAASPTPPSTTRPELGRRPPILNSLLDSYGPGMSQGHSVREVAHDMAGGEKQRCQQEPVERVRPEVHRRELERRRGADRWARQAGEQRQEEDEDAVDASRSPRKPQLGLRTLCRNGSQTIARLRSDRTDEILPAVLH